MLAGAASAPSRCARKAPTVNDVPRDHPVKSQIAALAGVALLVASCGGKTAGAQASMEPQATPSPSATSSSASAAPKPTGEALVAEVATIDDSANDLINEDFERVEGVPEADITSLSASADGENLKLTVEVVEDVSDEVSTDKEFLYYQVVIETDGSAQLDYYIGLVPLDDGSWLPMFTDWASGQSQDAGEFPGSYVVAENALSMTIALTALGEPSSLRMSAIAQLVDGETQYVKAEDKVPDGLNMLVPSDAWLTLAP